MLFWSVILLVAQCTSATYYYYRQPYQYNNYRYPTSGGLQNYLQQYYGGNTVGLDNCDFSTLSLINNYFRRLVPSLCPSLLSSCPTMIQYASSGSTCQIRYRASLISQMCCQSSSETTRLPETTTTTTASTTASSSTTKTCGISEVNPARSFASTSRAFTTLKIVGGSTASTCEYPWMAYLEIGNYLCGGTIIDETHILTAAHCLMGFDQSDVRVTVGEHDTSVNSGKEQVFTASEVKVHENYNTETFENDIAMITLDSPITYNDCAQPACLPEGGQTWPKGTDCVTAGWGVTTEGGNVPTTLQEVTVPYYSSEDCLNDFTGYTRNDIFGSTLCAGFPEGKKDACQGDSGGPLMCPSGGSWYVAGVVSTGYGCAQPNYPGIYTNVASYRDWVESNK